MKLIFSSVFLALLLLPNVVLLFGLDKNVKSNEVIKFKTFPEFDIKSPRAFISSFKSYYTENHGLKKTHINNYISIKRSILHDDPIPNRVVEGANGWFFLGNYHNNVLNDVFGNKPLLKEELEKISVKVKEYQSFFQEKKIGFYIVIPPNKHSIYSEELPFSLNKKATQLDVLKTYLQSRNDFEIIDLRENFLKEKETQLYLKTDTHWNEYGAFIGYEKVMEKIMMTYSIGKRNMSEYTIVESKIKERDLGRMINLNSETSNLSLVPKFKETKKVMEWTNNRIHIVNNEKPLKLLMYKDSFANAWMDFFNETFGEVVYIRGSSVIKEDIEKEKPDIVILELVERNINNIGK